MKGVDKGAPRILRSARNPRSPCSSAERVLGPSRFRQHPFARQERPMNGTRDRDDLDHYGCAGDRRLRWLQLHSRRRSVFVFCALVVLGLMRGIRLIRDEMKRLYFWQCPREGFLAAAAAAAPPEAKQERNPASRWMQHLHPSPSPSCPRGLQTARPKDILYRER